MAKQPQSFIEYAIEYIRDFDSFPFEDYYIFLVLRFIVYIYLFIKLSDILLGYERPNLKTRVLRKFQFVYGQQILKQLDKDDMQQLQITITNTILNATKQLSVKKVYNMNCKNGYNGRYEAELQRQSKMQESERRQLRNEDGCESTRQSLSKKSLRLKFDLDRNQYIDPPSGVSSLITVSEKEKPQEFHEYQVQGESEEENLSPKHQKKPQSQPIGINKGQLQTHQQIELISKQPQSEQIQSKKRSLTSGKINEQESERHPQANIHYPQEELQGMQLQMQQKLIRTQQNLLHLSDENLNASMMGRQSFLDEKRQNGLRVYSQKDEDEGMQVEQDQNVPSIIKTQSTKMTDTYIDELDT